jgi:hypothetical protein
VDAESQVSSQRLSRRERRHLRQARMTSTKRRSGSLPGLSSSCPM